jgi:hypothetical protein
VGLASTDFSEVSLRAIVKQDPQEEEENVLLGGLCFKLVAGWFQKMDIQTKGLKVELFRLQGGM